MTGIERIEKIFTGKPERIRLMTHAVGGWPDSAVCEAIVQRMLVGGADLVEVQLPFSEPAADGPVIVAANHEALSGGATTRSVLEMMARLKKYADGLQSVFPKSLLVMSYLNPILAYGEEAFVADALAAGVDGLIVPDCSPDEISPLPELAHAAGLAFVPLIAPATDDARIAMICQRFVSPFVYAVLRYGVTGRATAIDRETRDYLERVKLATGRAVAAGFGIREGAQVEALRGLADCVVVGSVFIKSVKDAVETGQDVLAGISDCVRELKK